MMRCCWRWRPTRMEGEVMNRRAALLVIAVFLLGVALGGLGVWLAASRDLTSASGQPSESAKSGEKGQSYRTRIVEQLTRELALTPEQQQQLAAILEETKAKYHALYEQIRPQREEVRQQGRQRIRAILMPEQLPKFEEWLRRVDEERKKKEKH